MAILTAAVAIAMLTTVIIRYVEVGTQLKAFAMLAPATPSDRSIFGPAEYLAALALLFVVLTTSDFRYRFRLYITTIKAGQTAFFLSFAIGFALLVIDYWFHNRLPIPIILNDANNIKIYLATLFISLIFYLSFVSIISPPTFSRWNARPAFSAVHHFVARGNPDQLAVIADWIGQNAGALVKLAATRSECSQSLGGDAEANHKDYAAYMLLLLGNRRLCQQMVDKSPWSVAAVFSAAAAQPHGRIPINQFASNVGAEFILNQQSALYAEDDGYTSGLLGYTKPITTAVYSDYLLIEALASSGGSPLEPNFVVGGELNSKQLEAYSRAALIFSRSYVNRAHVHRSYAFTRAIGIFESATATLYRVTEPGQQSWQSDELDKLYVTIRFIRNMIEVLSEQPTPNRKRRQNNQLDGLNLVHSQLAGLIYDIIKRASRIDCASDLCWHIQHNAIFAEIFAFDESNSTRLVQFYLRRLMYDEIKRIDRYPNFVSAGIIGYCLNVFGIDRHNSESPDSKSFAPVQRAAAAWAKKNFMKLARDYPAVADACLVGGITFDPTLSRLTKTYSSILGRPPQQRHLELQEADQPPYPR